MMGNLSETLDYEYSTPWSRHGTANTCILGVESRHYRSIYFFLVAFSAVVKNNDSAQIYDMIHILRIKLTLRGMRASTRAMRAGIARQFSNIKKGRIADNGNCRGR